MMGLLSTIRGKRDTRVIGSTAVGPIANRDKKLVIQEWPRLLEQQPHLFQIVWNASSARSNSIKVITMQLDDDIVRSTCEQLGARHVDFIARGFNSNFWDIFLVCMAETIDETLSRYLTDEGKRAEMILAWQRCCT
uniref:GLOBIN domain-containing protein n=1 Tax=Angiostrongylus cantonensis TaxID=6313 RepID=A0A0K0DES5_ANGCA